VRTRGGKEEEGEKEEGWQKVKFEAKRHGVQLPIDSVHECDYIPKREFVSSFDLSSLKETIRAKGQIENIKANVCKCPVGQGYDIIAGHQRVKMMKEIGEDTVIADVYDLSKEDACRMAIIDDEARIELHPLDRARRFQYLMQKLRMTEEEIAKEIGKSKSYVSHHVRLLKLKPKTLAVISKLSEKVVTSQLGVDHLKPLLKIEDEEKQAEIAKRIIKERLTVSKIRRLVKRITKPERPVIRPKVRCYLLKKTHIQELTCDTCQIFPSSLECARVQAGKLEAGEQPPEWFVSGYRKLGPEKIVEQAVLEKGEGIEKVASWIAFLEAKRPSCIMRALSWIRRLLRIAK